MADADQKMVTIGCRHAPGVRLRVSEWFKVPGQPEPQLREVAIHDLAGVSPDYLGHQDGSEIGYTRIPAEDWDKWLKLNERSDLITSGALFVAPDEAAEGDLADDDADEQDADGPDASEDADEQDDAGGGDDGDEDPAGDAELDSLTDDELRANLRDRGVAVDGRWQRKRLLTEAEKVKAGA